MIKNFEKIELRN